MLKFETDRKVPSRTPPQRLNTLNRFTGQWIENLISNAINRPTRADTMTKNMEIMSIKLLKTYFKDCHFFDPTVLPHGGPNPNSQRKRRAAFAQQELNRIAREVEDNESLDIFDQLEEDLLRGDPADIRALSNDPNVAWKQIGTGFRKWILRYISDCGGQKQYQYHTKGLAKV